MTVLPEKELRDFHQRNRGQSGISFSTPRSGGITFLNSDPTPIAIGDRRGAMCALVAGSFSEGVLMAVNHDGDSDLIGKDGEKRYVYMWCAPLYNYSPERPPPTHWVVLDSAGAFVVNWLQKVAKRLQ